MTCATPLITHGWICPAGSVVIIRRYVLPLNLSLQEIEQLQLELQNINDITLSVALADSLQLDIEQQTLNLTIQEINKMNLNIKPCED